MANDAHKRTLSICTVGLCLLSLATASAAVAAHGHSELGGRESTSAEAGSAGSGQSGAGPSGAGEAGAGASAGGSSSAAGPAASQQTGAAGSSAQAHGAPASDTSASSDTRTAASQQPSHKKEAVKPKRSHERALQGRGAPKSATGGANGGTGGESAGAGVGTTTPATSSPASSTPDATAAAASYAPVGGTPTVSSASTSPGTATSTSTKAAGRARHARSHRSSASARRREHAANASSFGSLAPLGVASSQASSTSSPPAGHGRGAPARTHDVKAQRRLSPIVTTITKIVDVVPSAVRELIVALLALALALAVRSRFAALRARRLERQRTGLLEDVGLLQAALLPTPPARLGPVGTSVAYQPAAGPGAGGDFYDVFALADGQLAVIVGDISGHGRQALPHTALVRFTLRAYLEAGLSPRDALQTAGAVLERQLGGVFATVVLATYHPRERVLVYACAGHPPPVVLGSRALAPITVCASPPIGVGLNTGTRQTVVSIPGRARICFYTDGVTEARVGADLFGVERLEDTLAELGPRVSASALLARVAERADARPDDMAACVLDVDGGDDAPALLIDELELDRDDVSAARAERFLLACGTQRDELSDAMRAARATAARTGAAVLEVRHAGDAPPHVTVQREHITRLPMRPTHVAVAL